jgi:hypothetical protein
MARIQDEILLQSVAVQVEVDSVYRDDLEACG